MSSRNTRASAGAIDAVWLLAHSHAEAHSLALETVIPINAASGHNVGVEALLHFFLDDMFPNTLGKPLFGGGSQ